MAVVVWKECAKLIPFLISQIVFWKFGADHGTYNITLENWRVKVMYFSKLCYRLFEKTLNKIKKLINQHYFKQKRNLKYNLM